MLAAERAAAAALLSRCSRPDEYEKLPPSARPPSAAPAEKPPPFLAGETRQPSSAFASGVLRITNPSSNPSPNPTPNTSPNPSLTLAEGVPRITPVPRDAAATPAPGSYAPSLSLRRGAEDGA